MLFLHNSIALYSVKNYDYRVNKTKVIRANLLDLAFALDFYFEDIFRFGNISVLVTFQFW